MKKLVSLIVAIAMMLTVCAFSCAEGSTEAWYATLYGTPVTLNIQEDGTWTMEANGVGVVSEGTWTKDEAGVTTLSAEGSEPVVLTPDGETMVSEDSGEPIVFTKEAPEAFVAPGKKAASDVAEFNGTYTMTMLEMEGMTLEYAAFQAQYGEMMGFETDTIVIDNGNVALFGGDPIEFALTEDGALMAGEDETACVIALTEDGGIVCNFFGMNIYGTSEQSASISGSSHIIPAGRRLMKAGTTIIPAGSRA